MTVDIETGSWTSLGCKLSKNTLNALKGLNFSKPTPIQTHVIPTFLKKKDIVAQAVTGSGKTLSFIIPIIELLNKTDSFKPTDIYSIILSPTTELAQQIYDMFNEFLSHFTGTKPNLRLFNKKSIETKFESNKGVVIISTPGVLAKSLEETAEKPGLIKSLKSLEILILDEADRLLEMGFEAQLLTIIKSLPKQRLTGLFSATQTTEVDDLTRAGLRNPVRVSVKVKKNTESEFNDNLPKNITNNYLLVEKENKLNILIAFLKQNKNKKIMVFFSACACVDYFHRVLSLILKKNKILAFHRKLKKKRSKIFDEFKQMKCGAMLCTDVLARGIDIPDIDWVIQYDPPKAATHFVHRCGRTARLDRFGQTLIFLRQSEDSYVHFLRENQNVDMLPYQCETGWDAALVPSFENQVRDLCAADRLLYEKSTRAFVSYIKSYRKHELKYIFKLTNINMGQLGNSFGLLRMPQMGELHNLDLSEFHQSDIDLSALVYKEKSVRKVREKTRIIKKERRENEPMEIDEEVTVKQNDSKKKKQLKKVKSAANKSENNSVKKSDIDHNMETEVSDNSTNNNKQQKKRKADNDEGNATAPKKIKQSNKKQSDFTDKKKSGNENSKSKIIKDNKTEDKKQQQSNNNSSQLSNKGGVTAPLTGLLSGCK